MKLNVEDIKKAVKDKEITAISLDTSIIDRLGRRLDQGLLKRMRQFRGTRVAVVFSDVVVREVVSHIRADVEGAHADFNRALKDLEDSIQLTKKAIKEASALLIDGRTPQAIAEQRWADFARKIQLTLVRASKRTSIQDVLDRYFESRLPFRDKGGKKNEFPDAFALLSLEQWAAEKKTRLLVLSHDEDWKDFCSQSERLDILEDLGDALACFQDEHVLYLCRELGVLLRKGDKVGIIPAIKTAIEHQDEKIEIHVESDSQFSVEEDSVDHSIEFLEIDKDELLPAFEAVEYRNSKLVALVRVQVKLKINVQFSFAKWDSIDREYLPMGTREVVTEEDEIIEVLVTFSGEIDRKPVVEQVELLPKTVHLSFYDLEPDWMSDPSSYDRD